MCGDRVVIEVWDTGIGIPQDQLVRAFDEFVRVHGRSSSGMGLGLAIVKRTATLPEIETEVHSVVGRRSVFRLSLPRALAGAASPRQRHGIQNFADTRVWVWVVDDDELVLPAMLALLDSWGCQARAFQTPEPVVAAIGSGEFPDLLITAADLADNKSGFDLHDVVEQKARTKR